MADAPPEGYSITGTPPQAPATATTATTAPAPAAAPATPSPINTVSPLVQQLHKDFPNPVDFFQAFDYLQRQQSAVDREAVARERANNEANDATLNHFMGKILNNQPVTEGDLADALAKPPGTPGYLKGTTADHLRTVIDSKSVNDVKHTSIAYGPGYFDVQSRILAKDGDERKITNPDDVLALTNPKISGFSNGQAWLTPAGAKDILSVMQMRKTQEGEGNARTIKAIDDAAAQILTGAPDVNFPEDKDPQGKILLEQFKIRSAKLISDAIREGKLNELDITKGDLGNLINSLRRPRDQWTRDILAAPGTQPNTPPKGVTPTNPQAPVIGAPAGGAPGPGARYKADKNGNLILMPAGPNQ